MQVIAPSVRAYLYTWGGRKTAEGEQIPVRIEELDIGYIDGMLLLPLVVEHNIDERSPLYGHTYESLRVCSQCPMNTDDFLISDLCCFDSGAFISELGSRLRCIGCLISCAVNATKNAS